MLLELTTVCTTEDDRIRLASRIRRNSLRKQFRRERYGALLDRRDAIFGAPPQEEPTMLDHLGKVADKFFSRTLFDSDAREEIFSEAVVLLMEGLADPDFRVYDARAYFRKGLGIATGRYMDARVHREKSEDPNDPGRLEVLIPADELRPEERAITDDPFLRPSGAPPAPHASPELERLYLEQRFGEADASLLWELMVHNGESLEEAAERLGMSRRQLYRKRAAVRNGA